MNPTPEVVEEGRTIEKLFWLLVVCAVFHLLYYYPLLPERVASHFDARGRPNGWSDKTVFFSIYGGVVVLMSVLQAMTRFSLPKTPVSLINLPHKDYWLSPERRDETMAILMKYMSGFWSATLLFLMCTMHLAIQLNLGRRNFMEWFFFLLAGFVLFTLVWTISLIRRFSGKRISSKR